MTERVTWICDGCDATLVVTEGETSDWRLYKATLDNASGYPLCRSSGTIHIGAHLCPSCAQTLAEKINPRSWPRLGNVEAA